MRRRRLSAGAGQDSFQKFVAHAARHSLAPPLTGPMPTAHLLVATCRGLAKLSQRCGRRIMLIRVAAPDGDELRSLNGANYGSHVVDAASPMALEATAGWRDWSQVGLSHAMGHGMAFKDGLSIKGGRLAIGLGPFTGVSAFARRFASLMRQRRHHEALMTGTALSARLEAGLPLNVAPRFCLHPDGHGLQRIDDFYVFDPWRDLAFVATLARAAAMPDPDGSN